MRRNGKPPAARTVLARNPFTWARRLPALPGTDTCSSSPSRRQQFLAAFVAHQQPLFALAAHVAHGDVGQHVRVVDAGAARQREEIRRQAAKSAAAGKESPGSAVRKAQFDLEVRAEFEVRDRLRARRQQRQELVEALGGGVVGARRADHVDALEAKFQLERTQGVDLAGNADDRDATQCPAREQVRAAPAAARIPCACRAPAAMSCAFVTSTGTGRQRSAGSGATVNTASTRPDYSSRSPMLVAMPVHWAPSRAGSSAARTMRRNGPKCSSSGRRCIAGAAVHAKLETRVIRRERTGTRGRNAPVHSTREMPQSVHRWRGSAAAKGKESIGLQAQRAVATQVYARYFSR